MVRRRKPKGIRPDAKRVARVLYEAYTAQEGRGVGCGELFYEWMKEEFWGRVIRDYIPIFNKTWRLLKKRGHVGNDNRWTYGDADVGVWIEEVKDKDKKIIVSTRYCSMADDNTHIFVRRKGSCGDKNLDLYFSSFIISTVWERQKKLRKKQWDRKAVGDITYPSLNTYREKEFEYGREDENYHGRVVVYKDFDKLVKKAYMSENKIDHALWTLSGHLEMLEDEYEN
tara:strand:+ start:28 stop:708 length:681 start_codon:yes stop_codon:yes gene_type:complete